MGFEPGSLGAMSKWFIHYAATPHLENCYFFSFTGGRWGNLQVQSRFQKISNKKYQDVPVNPE